ncbi:sensor histidine kinase [Novosphingobium album (ex Liu et al. 2023)]|uniref:histidine kinase n=1 Tax=Novosphingobium album (ex Liu et al. 2023) TaxID=3031130 RepID=A0ABT5WT63_9SPHN|nr:PAS domain-containing sensor histidine kinase [Novosphingobium album (ex Liu et al. 2023)]MDE8652587.1 PAS domain S-box protein [Novosphingobium album (ex Liu et al. 2023)]
MNDRFMPTAGHRESFFRALVEAAITAIVAVDAAGRIVEVNRKTEELFGHGRDALLGRSVEMLVPERYRAAHPGFVAGFMAAPSARPMGVGRELFALRRDGEEFPVEIGLSPFETGEGLFTLASIIDITDRRRADEARALLAAIVTSSPDAILSKSLDGTITSWNAAATQLFGFAADEVIGRSIHLILPPEQREEEADLLGRVGAGEYIPPFVTRRMHRDGGLIDVSMSLAPLRDHRGVVTGASSIVRDITVAKQRDAELRRSNAELEQFAYVASHDLQEPLRMVANYVELLARRYEGQLDERADKYIHYASDGARRMQRLVADLLSYSRVGSQSKPLVPLDSRAVVEDVIRSLGRAIRASGATVDVGALPMVLGDEVQLGQLFQNLVGNALKFRAEAPPVIRIAAVPQGGLWQFSVADNGIGMDMRFADRIFQMFQRLNERGKYDGSGIGLTIAKRIVERHGGLIWVDAELGRGTTFRFTLPAATREPPR